MCLGPAKLGYGSWVLGRVWDWLHWGLGLSCWAVFGAGCVGVWVLGCVWDQTKWGLGLGCWAVFGAGCIRVWILVVGMCLGPGMLGYRSWLLGCVWDCWCCMGLVFWGCFWGLAVLGSGFGLLGCVWDWLYWGKGLGYWVVCVTRCIGVWGSAVGLFQAGCTGVQVLFFGLLWGLAASGSGLLGCLGVAALGFGSW